MPYQTKYHPREGNVTIAMARIVANNLETLLPTKIYAGRVIDEFEERDGRRVHVFGYRFTVNDFYVKVIFDPRKRKDMDVETEGPHTKWVDDVLNIHENISVIANQRH